MVISWLNNEQMTFQQAVMWKSFFEENVHSEKNILILISSKDDIFGFIKHI